MRLDLETFTISQPSTSSDPVGTILNGVFAVGAGKAVSTRSQCLTDTFTVASPGTTSPPVICGDNSGQHMYVDVCENCVDLSFQLGSGGTNRQFSIKVTQYSCDYNNLAPKGCTQYFYGDTSQPVKSFNYDGGQHLANQNQQVCVRNERGMCRICWVQIAVGDFDVSAVQDPADPGSGKVTNCCSYGIDGSMTTGYDCVNVPGALQEAITTMAVPSQICGQSWVTAEGMVTASVCSKRCPFSIHFATDNWEFVETADNTDEGARDNQGFMLTYIQDSVGC